jgi:hypothetical protein
VVVALVHTVTPVSCVRSLQARVPELSVEIAYAQLWQVGAALVAALSTQPVTLSESSPPRRETASADSLTAAALECRDPHAVKFTEACLREHAIHPDPVYLEAADHVISHLPAW